MGHSVSLSKHNLFLIVSIYPQSFLSSGHSSFSLIIEPLKSKDSDILEKIIRHHIGIGNNIVTDGWGVYNWRIL